MSEWEKIEQAPTHDFEAEKELIGVFTGVEENVGSNNSNLYSLEKGNGERISFWGSTLLDSRMKNTQIGQEIKIVYKGKVKNEKSGRTYKNFEVFKKKGDKKVENIKEMADELMPDEDVK